MKVNATPLRDVQEEAPVGYGDCGHEVYRGESIFEWEGRMLCTDCWRRAVGAALEECPEQLALEMQLSVERFV